MIFVWVINVYSCFKGVQFFDLNVQYEAYLGNLALLGKEYTYIIYLNFPNNLRLRSDHQNLEKLFHIRIVLLVCVLWGEKSE